MTMHILYVVLIHIFFHGASGKIYSLEDSKPYLMNEGKTIGFHEGGAAFLIASSDGFRIGYRGMRVVQEGDVRETVLHEGWNFWHCNVSAFSLCESVLGHVFPLSDVIRVGNDTESFACKDSSGKSITAEKKVYDFSACDVIAESYDIVYVNSHLGVYVRKCGLPLGIYWVLIVICIYLVRHMSISVLEKVQESGSTSKHSTDSHYVTLAVVTACIICLCVVDSAVFIFEHDYVFWVLSMAYAWAYLVFHICFTFYFECFEGTLHGQPRIFNLAMVCIQLIITRLYGGAETPYTAVCVGVLGMRLWDKMLSTKFYNSITGLIDSLYISVLITWGYTDDYEFLFILFFLAKFARDKVMLR